MKQLHIAFVACVSINYALLVAAAPIQQGSGGADQTALQEPHRDLPMVAPTEIQLAPSVRSPSPDFDDTQSMLAEDDKPLLGSPPKLGSSQKVGSPQKNELRKWWGTWLGNENKIEQDGEKNEEVEELKKATELRKQEMENKKKVTKEEKKKAKKEREYHDLMKTEVRDPDHIPYPIQPPSYSIDSHSWPV